MKKTMLLFFFVMMGLSFAGCSGGNDTGGNDPQAAVARTLDAFKAADMEALSSNVIDLDLDNDVDFQDEALLKTCTKYMTYSIESSEIDGDTAIVKTNISNVSVGTAFTNMMGLMFTDIMAGIDVDTDSDDVMMEYFEKAIEEEKNNTITTTVEIHLQKVDGDWMVEMEEEIGMAIMGGDFDLDF